MVNLKIQASQETLAEKFDTLVSEGILAQQQKTETEIATISTELYDRMAKMHAKSIEETKLLRVEITKQFDARDRLHS